MTDSRQASDAQQEQFLRVQKENLAAQVKVQKTRIAELEVQLQQLQQRESVCQQSLMHTEDLWTQLQRNLQAAAVEAGIPSSSHLTDDSQLVHNFLHSLASRDAAAQASVQEKLTNLHSNFSENERMLSIRASGTQQTLAAILGRLQQLSAAKLGTQAQSAADAIGSSAMGAAEQIDLQGKIQAQQSIHLATQALLDQASSQNDLLKNRIADLQSLLLDTEDSLDTARKKLAKQSTGPSQAAAGRSDSAARQPSDVESAVELQQLQQLLHQRTSDLERQRSMSSKLER